MFLNAGAAAKISADIAKQQKAKEKWMEEMGVKPRKKKKTKKKKKKEGTAAAPVTVASPSTSTMKKSKSKAKKLEKDYEVDDSGIEFDVTENDTIISFETEDTLETDAAEGVFMDFIRDWIKESKRLQRQQRKLQDEARKRVAQNPQESVSATKSTGAAKSKKQAGLSDKKKSLRASQTGYQPPAPMDSPAAPPATLSRTQSAPADPGAVKKDGAEVEIVIPNKLVSRKSKRAPVLSSDGGVDDSTAAPVAEDPVKVIQVTPWYQMELPPKNEIVKRISEDHNNILLDMSAGSSELGNHLYAFDSLLQQFVAISKTLRKDPEDGDRVGHLEQKIYTILEEYMYPHVINFHETSDEWVPGDAAQMVSWIESGLVELMEEKCPYVQLAMDKWNADKENFVEIYMEHGVRKQMRKVLDFAGESLYVATPDNKDQMRTNNSGHVVSGRTEDILFYIEMQISVAREVLPPQYVEVVLAHCNKEIYNAFSEAMHNIVLNWRKVLPSRFCSFINDSQRLCDALEARNEEILKTVEFQEIGDKATRDVVDFSMKATTFLTERILLELSEPKPVLSSVGTSDWEADSAHMAIRTTIVTMQDYFVDIEEWLEAAFFYRLVLKNCFDYTMKMYIESFFGNTMKTGIRNSQAVSYRLDYDYRYLLAFFSGPYFDKYFDSSGFHSLEHINERMNLIKSMGALMDPNVKPDDLSAEVETILNQLGCNDIGKAAVLHMTALRSRTTRSQDVNKWLQLIARAERKIVGDDVATEGSSGAKNETQGQGKTSSSYYNLPDMRNSRFLQQVKVDKQSLRRELSGRSFRSTEAVSSIMQGRPMPNNAAEAASLIRERGTDILENAKSSLAKNSFFASIFDQRK